MREAGRQVGSGAGGPCRRGEAFGFYVECKGARKRLKPRNYTNRTCSHLHFPMASLAASEEKEGLLQWGWEVLEAWVGAGAGVAG